MENNNTKAKVMAGICTALFILLFPCIFIGMFLSTFSIMKESVAMTIFGFILAGIGWLFEIAACIIIVIANWKIFEKMGEPGWKSIIPFYNTYTLLEKANYPGLLILLALVPGFGSLAVLVILFIALISIGEKFGKTTGWSILCLCLFNMVGLPFLAWSDDTFNPTLGHQANS